MNIRSLTNENNNIIYPRKGDRLWDLDFKEQENVAWFFLYLCAFNYLSEGREGKNHEELCSVIRSILMGVDDHVEEDTNFFVINNKGMYTVTNESTGEPYITFTEQNILGFLEITKKDIT